MTKISARAKQNNGKEKHRQRSGRGQKNREQKMSGWNRSRVMRYLAAAFVLVSLVFGAFLGPQLVFGIQDSYRCRDTEYSERERMDISVMTTSYEPVLKKRLLSFAEGLAKGTNYYVASQELEVTWELYDQLEENSGFQMEMLTYFLGSLLSDGFLEGFTVEQWKQYVIYSDDYAEGVNFILWYLKIQDALGIETELLMDAEYGELYAVRSSGIAIGDLENIEFTEKWQEEMDNESAVLRMEGYDRYSSWLDYWRGMNIWGTENMWGLWYSISYVFDAMDAELRDSIYMSVMENEDSYLEIVEDDRQFVEKLIREERLFRILDGGYTFQIILYYEEYSLDFYIRIQDEMERKDSGYTTSRMYPGIIIGLSDLYSLIPEFAVQ